MSLQCYALMIELSIVGGASTGNICFRDLNRLTDVGG